jgi:hypothetical protein
MKAVLAVGLIALMLASSSLLLSAAGSHGAGVTNKLEPGAQHWYTLACPGSGTVNVRMDVDPDGAAAFMIVTPDAVRAWEAGEELAVTGRGASNPTEDAELFWSGSCEQAGEFYLVVEYNGDGSAPSYYSLDVSGAQVSSEALTEDGLPAGADGIWCYLPEPAPPEWSKVVGEDTLLTAGDIGDWTGTFAGESDDFSVGVFHSSGRIMGLGTISFASVEVSGMSGGLEMHWIGEKPDPGSDWEGTWTITSATGDLEGLQGEGVLWGPGYNPEKPSECGVLYYSVADMDGIDFGDNEG